MNDQEINAALAEKVAGWKPSNGDFDCAEAYEKTFGEVMDPHKMFPDYLHDANAVIALLERGHHDVKLNFSQTTDEWYCVLEERFIGIKQHLGIADTFTRAACYALLRAAGVTVTE